MLPHLFILCVFDVVVNRPQRFGVRIQRIEFFLDALTFSLQLFLFLLPCGDGEFSVYRLAFQLAFCQMVEMQSTVMLRFVGLTEHIKAFITEPSGGIVLVNLDEQPLEFGYTLLVLFQLLSADADLR